MNKTVIVMLIAVLVTTVGDILMSRAMRDTGGVETSSWSAFKSTFFPIVFNPVVWVATALMATFFVLWLLALSWSDLTYVLPFTALTYVLNALLAPYFLNETVTPTRWLGTILVFLGVLLIVKSGPAQG